MWADRLAFSHSERIWPGIGPRPVGGPKKSPQVITALVLRPWYRFLPRTPTLSKPGSPRTTRSWPSGTYILPFFPLLFLVRTFSLFSPLNTNLASPIHHHQLHLRFFFSSSSSCSSSSLASFSLRQHRPLYVLIRKRSGRLWNDRMFYIIRCTEESLFSIKSKFSRNFNHNWSLPWIVITIDAAVSRDPDRVLILITTYIVKLHRK